MKDSMESTTCSVNEATARNARVLLIIQISAATSPPMRSGVRRVFALLKREVESCVPGWLVSRFSATKWHAHAANIQMSCVETRCLPKMRSNPWFTVMDIRTFQCPASSRIDLTRHWLIYLLRPLTYWPPGGRLSTNSATPNFFPKFEFQYPNWIKLVLNFIFLFVFNLHIYLILYVLDSIVVSIPACHAGGRGSIPRRGEFFFFFY